MALLASAEILQGMDGGEALLRAFSGTASAKLKKKKKKLIREMLKMERGRLQPRARQDLGPWLIACHG